MSFPVDIKAKPFQRPIENLLRFTITNTNPIALFEMTGFESFVISIDNGGQSSNSTFSILGSNDNVQWSDIPIKSIQPTPDIVGRTLTASNTRVLFFGANKTTKYVQLSITSGTALHRVNVVRNSAPLNLVNNDLLHSPDLSLSYVSPVGGIVASPVTIFSALNLSQRNLLKSFQATNNGTATAEISILDGSGGAALFRQIIPVNGVLVVDFNVAIRTSPSNLLQLTLTSSASLAVSFNAQGAIVNS